jgi:endoribonuclease Nob1
MPVLDTAALLHWPVDRMQGGIVAHSQLEELRKLSPQRAMLVESIEMEWMSMSTGDAENAAASTGDLPRLSPVDLDILAIALATGQTLFTDDYSLQNVCRSVNHPFEAVSNKRSKQQWSWELRCIGCRATKKADSQKEQECDICGSPMKIKRSRR